MLRIILLTLVISSASTHLIDPDNYANLVTKQMMENFEKNPYPLELLKLPDFIQKIDSTRYDKKAVGTMTFHSGFVTSIGSAAIAKNQSFLSDKNIKVRILFELKDIRTTYDIHYDLKDYTADGAIILKFVAISYEIEIIRQHGSDVIQSTIKYIGTTGSQKFMKIIVDPENAYTQIVAREIKSKSDFRIPMNNSFGEWRKVLKAALDEAIMQTPFPKINYYQD